MADGARERRAAIRGLAELRRRQAAAEDARTDALAAMKSAEGAFDAAEDRFSAAERALDAARERRAQAHRERYAPGRHGRVRQARSAFDRTGVLIVEVSAQRPDWWCHPGRCATGHEWGPGRVLVSGQRCHCAGAQTLHPDRAIWGTFHGRLPGGELPVAVWYDPPHEPVSEA